MPTRKENPSVAQIPLMQPELVTFLSLVVG